MFVTSRQLDKVLLCNMAMTTGELAQTVFLFFVIVPADVARYCGLELVIVLFNSVVLLY